MNQQSFKATPSFRWFTNLAAGYLVLLFLVFAGVIFVFKPFQKTPDRSPTPTPAATVVPHILVHEPADKSAVTYEDFSSNDREWGLYFQYGKLEVINGKLILQSNVPNGSAVGTSQRLAPDSENYYIQADFSTDIDTATSYGLVFGLNKSLATYYLFEIWPQPAGFRLLKYNSGKWTEIFPYSSAEINPFPQSNTLSVYFDKGQMELYINGKLATKYSDKDYFQSKDIGLFVNNAGFRLLVDDLFVHDKK